MAIHIGGTEEAPYTYTPPTPPAPPPPPDKGPKKKPHQKGGAAAKPAPVEQFKVSGGGAASATGQSGGGLGQTGIRTQRWLFTGNINITYDPVLRWETYVATIPPMISGEPTCFEQIDISDMAEQGYYRCTFRLHGPREFLQEMFFNGLGRHVQVTNPEGGTIWEGKLFEETLNVRQIQAVNSLKDEYNSVWSRYRITGASTTNDSTAQQDAPARAQYGNRDYVLSAGELDTSGIADQICNRVLQWQRKPKPTLVPSSSVQAEPYVDVMCIGYADTLSWQIYNQTVSTGSEAASSLISDVITAKGQYIASTSIRANSTSVTKVYNVDRDAGGIVLDVARLGDSLYYRWLVRVISNRLLTYSPAASPNLPTSGIGGGGLPVFDQATAGGQITPGSGANRILIAWLYVCNQTNMPSVSGATANGVAMTHIPGLPAGGYNPAGKYLMDGYYLIAPSAGVLYTIAWSGSNLVAEGHCALTELTYTNVHQTAPFGGTTGVYGATSVAATSQVGWLAIDSALGNGANVTIAVNSGQTQRENYQVSGGAFCGVSDKTATASTTTMAWSSSGTAYIAAICLAPAPSLQASSIAYKFDIWHPDHPILDAQGNILPPWMVRSNNWVQIAGAGMVGVKQTSSFVDDPTLFYIEKCEWKDGQDIPTITNNRGNLLDVVIARIASRSSV